MASTIIHTNPADLASIPLSPDPEIAPIKPIPGRAIIYGATYSGIPVYEMMVNGIPLMRRRSDSYFNVTALLKVVGVEKARRTKILERELQLAGVYEKVQGGYGKYQGTWFPLLKSMEFAKKYGCHELIKPLADYQPSVNGHLSSHSNATLNFSGRGSSSFISRSTASQKPYVKQESGASYSSRPIGRPKRRNQDIIDDSDSSFDEDDLALSPPPTSTTGASNTRAQRNIKRQRLIDDSDDDDSLLDDTASTGALLTHSGTGTPFKPVPILSAIERQRALLLSIFTHSDRNFVPPFLTLPIPADAPAFDADLAIDDAGHTALHWAATLAKIPLAAALLATSTCTPTVRNRAGETALARAVQSANNHEAQSFARLLELLGVEVMRGADARQRTVLHHLALGCGVRGHTAAARYYLECVLEAVAVQGRREDNVMDLKGFVDAQDANGDTALNIAARLGGRVAAEMLLEAGANASITNAAGLKPVDFGLEEVIRSNKSARETELPAFADSAGISSFMIKNANDAAHGLLKHIGTLHEAFTAQVKTSEAQFATQEKRLDALSSEFASLTHASVLLREQNSRLPDLHAKHTHAAEALRAQVERDGATARDALERDLQKVRMNLDEDRMLESLFEEATGAARAGDTGLEVVKRRIGVLHAHLGREEEEIQRLEADVVAAKVEDEEHQMKYRRLISSCCAIPLPDVSDQLVSLMLTAVQSEDTGTSAGFGSDTSMVLDELLAMGSMQNGMAANGGTANGNSASVQQDTMMDGLLFKAAALAPE
ncbi:hypothetical protein BC830DRAFT_1122887 [Chytriomyces sp. MP71]|nr:hypothetical protein BC830DRAFT_1122887 [Chytriomyces sp. MP71]